MSQPPLNTKTSFIANVLAVMEKTAPSPPEKQTHFLEAASIYFSVQPSLLSTVCERVCVCVCVCSGRGVGCKHMSYYGGNMQHVGSGMCCNLISASTGMQSHIQRRRELGRGTIPMWAGAQRVQLLCCPWQPNCTVWPVWLCLLPIFYVTEKRRNRLAEWMKKVVNKQQEKPISSRRMEFNRCTQRTLNLQSSVTLSDFSAQLFSEDASHVCGLLLDKLKYLLDAL